MGTNRTLLFDKPAEDDIVIDFLSKEEFLSWAHYPDGRLRFPLGGTEDAELLFDYASESGKVLGLVGGSLGYFVSNPMDIQPTTILQLVKEAYLENKKKVSIKNELHLTKTLQKKAAAEQKVLQPLFEKVSGYEKWHSVSVTG